MKRDKNIVGAIVIIVGIGLLVGSFFAYPPTPGITVAGSVLIGSWLISRSINKGNSS